MKTLASLTLLLATAACGTPDAGEDAELPGGSITIWTDSTELFMEHPALIVGDSAKFAVHLTDLTDFAPLRSGTVTLRFAPRDGGAAVVVVQREPRVAGIYGPTVTFPRPGTYDLTMLVASPQARDSIVIPGLQVFATAADVPAGGDDDGGIPFLKEQQWRTPGFANAAAAEGTVTATFEAAGEVVPAAGRVAEVAAPIGGLIEVGGVARSPAPGQWVDRGDVLVLLTPSLGEGGNAWAQARRELREAEDEYRRAQRLYAAQAIPERRLHEADIRLTAAREALAGLAGGRAADIDSLGRLPIRAPVAGRITSRAVVPGSRVAPGDPLFGIVDPSVVWLEVHVPIARTTGLGAGGGASFRLEGSERVYRAPRTVSVGTVVDSLSRTLLVLYEAPNRDGTIKVGATVRVTIGTGARVRGIVVPSSAVLDEDGRPIVYVQVSGERFEKRDLTVGASDGAFTAVTAGLRAGERVVTGAAYQIRLASQSSSVPAEGHAH
jgi:RND family efflux transporter MFP subunit